MSNKQEERRQWLSEVVDVIVDRGFEAHHEDGEFYLLLSNGTSVDMKLVDNPKEGDDGGDFEISLGGELAPNSSLEEPIMDPIYALEDSPDIAANIILSSVPKEILMSEGEVAVELPSKPELSTADKINIEAHSKGVSPASFLLDD